MKGKRRVTSYAVAEASGVSQATVSYVLNNVTTQKISESTRRKVLEAADRLSYRPYGPARTLSLGQSAIVLFVVPDFPIGHSMSALLDALAGRLTPLGRTLMTYRLPIGSPIGDIAHDVSPSAVISMMPLEEAQHEQLVEQGVTVEIVGLSAPATAGTRVLPNPQEGVGALQVRHLVERGHVVVGYGLPADERLRPFAVPRLEGVEQALARAGLRAAVVETIEADSRRAGDAVARWVRSGVTAVAAYNDDVALAVLAGARRHRVDVPGQLAVVGVDDIPAARLVEPSLSSVHVDMEHLAARIVGRLIRPDGPMSTPRNRTRVVRRSST